MKVALLCSGLGHVRRGHEVFARDLFDLLGDAVDITLFKGGGEPGARERVVPNVARATPVLRQMPLPAVSARWRDAVRDEESLRIEAETFAFGAMAPLLDGGYDIVHCLEADVCNIVFDRRHLFVRTPRVVFSNGGAIPGRRLPRCDFVQEHTPLNLRHSARAKAFLIPHGVDLQRFRPRSGAAFRQRLGIAPDAFVVISVGTLGMRHKRMDHVVREVAALPGAHLLAVGQTSDETPALRALATELLGDRAHLMTLAHEQLPEAYAAADVFTLGSLFETFGIVYVEAMAMGLPVVATQHPNQRGIIGDGVFIDMARPGALTAALRDTPPAAWSALSRRGPEIAAERYDLQRLKQDYVDRYRAIAAAPLPRPRAGWRGRVAAHLRHGMREAGALFLGRAE